MTSPTPHETEQQLADDYLAGAVLARRLSEKALELALKQVEDGTLRDPAKTAMNAAITSGTLLDKRLLLEGRPTQIHALEDPVQAGLALLKRHNITIDATATEIPQDQVEEPKPVPLLVESRPAKRARARARKAIPAAD